MNIVLIIKVLRIKILLQIGVKTYMNIVLSSGKCFSLLYIHVIYLMFCIKKQKKWKRINKHFTMMSY